MTLHEGEWLKTWFGANGETVYVLLNGLGLFWMIGSGGAMIWSRWRRPGSARRTTGKAGPLEGGDT
jgi:hypothetical protein